MTDVFKALFMEKTMHSSFVKHAGNICGGRQKLKKLLLTIPLQAGSYGSQNFHSEKVDVLRLPHTYNYRVELRYFQGDAWRSRIFLDAALEQRK